MADPKRCECIIIRTGKQCGLPKVKKNRNIYQNPERLETFCTQIKGKIQRKRAKTSQFRACGGPNGQYNSLIQHLYVKIVS